MEGNFEFSVDTSMHWADQMARKVIQERPNLNTYTCASGITPSGVVHIGNFREIITVDLVVKALRDLGKTVRFIYSWDDFDVFRKVPADMPKQEMLQKYLRYPIVDVPDPFDQEESYARHNEKRVEEILPVVGIHPEFIYQHKMYRDAKYADQIIWALKNNDKIKAILNNFRTSEVSEDWLPVSVFDPETQTDEVENLTWDGNDTLSFTNKNKNTVQVKISQGKYVKLKWRIDWPMRWKYEQVVFEPGGKDHSTEGGSYDTGKEISKVVFDYPAPLYIRYDFVQVKGQGGKISSSKGGVLTIQDVLEIYEPEIVRWLFAATRPNTDFAISFDADVIKIYEDFDSCERIYYGLEKDVSEKDSAKQKRIYEFSCVEKPKQKMPHQVGFRHLTVLAQVYQMDKQKVLANFKELSEVDKKRVACRLDCAINWLENYAPEEFKFKVADKINQEIVKKLDANTITAIKQLVVLLESSNEEEKIGKEFYEFCKAKSFDIKIVYPSLYQLLIGKTKGPKLIPFLFIVGKEKSIAMLKQASA